MRITRDMIDCQLDIINEKLKDTNKKIHVRKSYGYNSIELVDKTSGGSRDVRTGLTSREVYDCLYTFNELTYLIKREIEDAKRG
jgi:hypothetical protein